MEAGLLPGSSGDPYPTERLPELEGVAGRYGEKVRPGSGCDLGRMAGLVPGLAA